MVPTSDPRCPRREPLFDVHPLTAISIEVFYSDRTLETSARRLRLVLVAAPTRLFAEWLAYWAVRYNCSAYRHGSNKARVTQRTTLPMSESASQKI
jgi:hypothetical protein